MSLVIAYIGKNGAVMAGDLRQILFQGESSAGEILEEELYGGLIASDEELTRKAKKLGISLMIRDDKNKVVEQDGVLIGEVSSSEGGKVQKRRLYASAGSYAIADLENATMTVRQHGQGGNFVVLGNTITKKIAHGCIRDQWKNGTLSDAIKILLNTMETASRTTASVSKKFTLFQTMSKVNAAEVMDRDRQRLSRFVQEKGGRV
jgi:hypothetical protein